MRRIRIDIYDPENNIIVRKETRRISLWLMMSFQSENQRDKSLMLTYIITLGESFAELDSLAKVSQFGWTGMPIKGAPSQFSELGIVVQDGSWIRIMSKSQLISRIELIMKLFFWIFCEKIFRSFKIIFCWHLQSNKLSSSWFPRV